MRFKNLLAFLVLLCGTDILNRAPVYLEEKLRQFTGLGLEDISDDEDRVHGLDMHNRAIYDEYLAYWRVD